MNEMRNEEVTMHGHRGLKSSFLEIISDRTTLQALSRTKNMIKVLQIPFSLMLL